ncbi:hypothetical protein [Bradyrhizobium roseum]|uniref:hypothetical protein n=1 Tax=Bradyrhizobium roseum TaxID=3056648 RepID=UPI00262FA2EC|nr:hypothetical protein [Bradyrhizobium roseus]WKA29333.1 hypothetical protein QUH67_03840 [Bradyrhizobium roseus]
MSNETIQTFVAAQKRTYAKCLYGDLTCEEKPVDAHSIQNAKVIELIQDNGHVLMPDFRLVNGEPKLAFVKIGRNDASTFTGLCSKHDIELFKTIDTEPLNVRRREHLEQLAYRSVMRDLHVHLLNSEKAWAIHEQLCKAGGKNPAEVATAASIIALNHDRKGLQALNYREKHFDTPLSRGKIPDLQHLLITMNGQEPVVAASALLSSDFAEDGELIGPTFNVVPMDNDKSFAVLSYPSGQEPKIKADLPEIFDGDEDRLTYELAKLIIQRIENFVLSPSHYDKWSSDKKVRVLREFEANIQGPKPVEDHDDLNIFL